MSGPTLASIHAQNERILEHLSEQGRRLHALETIARSTNARCAKIDERLANGASKFQEHEHRLSMLSEEPKNGFHGQVILLVDDERGLTEVLSEFLCTCGAVPVAASSIARAHEIMAGHRPDAAIVDVVLPDGSGAEFVRELEALGIPALLTSGYPERLEPFGEARTVEKPSTLEIIRQKLLSILPTTAKTDPAPALPPETEPPTFSGDLDVQYVDREATTMPGSRVAGLPSEPPADTADESPQAKKGAAEPPCNE